MLFDTSLMISLWLPDSMVMNVAMPQLVLGAVGLGTMISYAIHRLKVVRRHEAGQRVHSALLLPRHLRQWLGGNHDVAGHARSRGR